MTLRPSTIVDVERPVCAEPGPDQLAAASEDVEEGAGAVPEVAGPLEEDCFGAESFEPASFAPEPAASPDAEPGDTLDEDPEPRESVR